MQTRYMERSNSMAREKRALESGSVADGDDDGQPERKRPALASVIVEALKVDSLQRLCSSLEPILRRVVSEEVERALAKLGPAKVAGRSSPKMIEGPDGRNLQLRFRTRLSLPLFTGGKVEGEQGAAVHIALFDANSGQVVTSGSESSVKLDVVVLEGDFSNEDDNWTAEEFESHVVKEREGKRPLLTGDVQMTLKEGIGTLGEFTFTDNSSWVRSRKFRLGLKVASGHCEGVRIREAKTEAFTVKDHRGELYKKHYPPALNDEVWRLEKIGKDGSFHKRLNKAEIYTVEDFLRYVVKDSQRLRNILGSGMSNKMWDALIEHAKTCVLSGKLYLYYPDGAGGDGVVFNNICEFSGLIASGQYYAADALSDNQKIYADTCVKKAYDNWLHVEEYDAKSLLRLKKNKVGDVSNSGSIISPQNPNSFSNQLSLPSAPVSAPMMQPSMDSSRKFEGYNGNVVGKYSIQAQNMSFNGSVQFNCSSVAQNQLIGTSDQTQFSRNKDSSSLGPSQSSLNIFQPIATPNLSSYRGIEDMLTEEEIRMRSLEMLEHEDMQHHLLRLFNMDGNDHAPVGRVEDEYTYSADYAPPPAISYGFEEVRTRSSGKAVVGWLKLKAALRWGIFVRKRAAERRAHVVELDDT